MAARHKSGLSAVVLPHFDIKHHMTFDLLVPGWYLQDVLFPDLESQSNIFCLLANRLPPQVVTILVVQLFRLLYRFWYPDPRLVSLNPVLGFDFSNYLVAFLQHIRNPPGKCQFHRYSRTNSFRSFSAIQFILPSFHCTRSSHPIVVSCRLLVPVLVVMKASCCFTSLPVVR